MGSEAWERFLGGRRASLESGEVSRAHRREVGGGQSSQNLGREGKGTPSGARAQRRHTTQQVWRMANSSVSAGAQSTRKKVLTRVLGLNLKALGAHAEAVGLPLQAG